MDDESRGPKTGAIIAAGVLIVAALVAIFFLVAAKPQQVAAPTTFKPFNASDKTFSCVSPDGWQVRSGSSMGIVSKARFEQGPARVEIQADLAGSLMGDIARTSAPQMEGVSGAIPGIVLPKPKPPVEALHEMNRNLVAREYKEYEEGKAVAFQSKAGDARYSEFIADGGFRVGKVHGYRVTMLGSERCITVICASPESSWKALQPAFQKVVGSVTPGQG